MEKESKETEYNRTISSKEKHNPKYKEFVEWCLANGMKWTGVDFPAFFGAEGHLRGVVTTRDIKPYEAIIAIPNKILMTTIQAKEDKYLGKLIKAHPDVFLVEEAGEYNILIAMLLRERAKGKDSFYYPFINLVDEIETCLVWDAETIASIEETKVKQQIADIRKDFEEEWQQMQGILEKYPNMFPNTTMKDYVWANQFVTTRCFGWYLPCTMLVPLADLINHYAVEQCTTEIVHRDLEQMDDDKKRQDLGYRKARGNYDISLLVPDAKFVAGNKKSFAVHFIEAFEKKSNFRLLSVQEEHSMALATAERILSEYQEIDVWDIPDWTPEDLEDNDSSEEENSVDQQDDFFDELHKLKERVQNAPRLIQSQNKYDDKYTEELKDSQKKKVEIMTFELGETQKPSDYKEYLEAVSKEEMDELDRSEEFSEHQSEFPWYTSVDNEVYFAILNNKNKVIKKGLELKVSYGSRTNKYLALWYGFSLTENHYDSYTFRLVIDDKVAKRAGLKFGLLNCFLSNDDRAKGYLNVNDYIVSTQLITTEFHSKLGRFNNDLLIFLRGHLHQGWIKENPELKNGSKFTLSIPFDLNFEIFIVQRYVEMHTELLLQFSRSDFEDEKILRHGNISGPRRAIVTCELGYKRILSRQIRLGNILLSILKSIKKSNQEFRKIYLSRNSEVDLPGENHLEYRLMLSHYLKRLFLSQLVK